MSTCTHRQRAPFSARRSSARTSLSLDVRLHRTAEGKPGRRVDHEHRRRPGSGPTANDPTLRGDRRAGRECSDGGDCPSREPVWPLWVSSDHGLAGGRGLAREPQAGSAPSEATKGLPTTPSPRPGQKYRCPRAPARARDIVVRLRLTVRAIIDILTSSVQVGKWPFAAAHASRVNSIAIVKEW